MHQSKKKFGPVLPSILPANQETLLQLYVSIVRPHMEYAAQAWDPHLKKDQDLATLKHTEVWVLNDK